MKGRLVRREDLDAGTRRAMYDLLGRFFEGIDRNGFEADLEDKNWAVLLESRGRLIGFSTLLYYRSRLAGGETAVVYSGDTIVDPRVWRSTMLSRAWIDSVLSLHDPQRDGRLLWLLVASGFRTYRYLPLFFREFYPRFDRPTPPRFQRLIDALARERFGELFDAATGIVRFTRPQILRDSLRRIPGGRRADSHVAFFARANAGHARGDELVCLAEIAEANLTPSAIRVVRSASRRRAVAASAS